MNGPPNTPDKFWGLVDVQGPDDCWLWQGKLSWCGNAQWYWRGRLRLVHHISLEIVCGIIMPRRTRKDGSSGIVVRHCCDVPFCVNPRHMILGSQLENVRDKVLRNRVSSGDLHPSAKITEKDIKRIKMKFKTGKYTKACLAEEYGLDASWLGRIINNKARKHAGLAVACWEVIHPQ